jgi:2-hydroxychromene-2-carboxylate isomerase
LAERRPVFYYDLNSPYAWLAAERVNSVLPEPPVWPPISYSHVIKHTGVTPWSVKPGREKQMEEIERRAEERGLRPIRWPEGWPVETIPLTGLRAATFAAELGDAVAFSLAGFRQTFNAGHPMSVLANVLRAAEASGLPAGAGRGRRRASGDQGPATARDSGRD